MSILNETDFEFHSDSFLDKMGSYKTGFKGTNWYSYHAIKYSSSLYSKHKDLTSSGFTINSIHKDIKDIKDTWYIDNYTVKELNNKKNIAHEFLARKVKMKYVDNNNQVIYSKKIYMPKEIVVDTIASKITKYGLMNIGQYHLGESIYYNKDKKNDKGLLIILNSGKNDTRYFFKPNDDGIIKFPKSFFSKIKDKSYLSITIVRGPTEQFNIKNESFKISASTAINLSLFSIKEN